MVAVRLTADLLERINAYARANGLTISDVLRQGAEHLIAGTRDLGPVTVSGTIVVTGAGQVQGLSSGGQGMSEQHAGFVDIHPELTLTG